MAAGDIARDTGYPRRAGNEWVLKGTIEVDATPRAFALTDTKSQLTDVQLHDEDGVGTAWVILNWDASGTLLVGVAKNGSIRVNGSHKSVDTYRFRATYV